MDVKINVRFSQGRCFFNGFNRRNDVDPKTGKAGVNYYRLCKIIACILEKLGFVKGIDCFVKGEPKVIYVNAKSFLKWRERHSKDEYITFMDDAEVKSDLETIEKYRKKEEEYAEYLRNPKFRDEFKIEKLPINQNEMDYFLDRIPRPLNEREIGARGACVESLEKFRKRAQEVLDFDEDFEGSIKFIIKSYKALSYDEIIEKAEKEFPENPLKKWQIDYVKGTLERSDYKESYAMKKIPEIYLHVDEDSTFWHQLPGIRCLQAK